MSVQLIEQVQLAPQVRTRLCRDLTRCLTHMNGRSAEVSLLLTDDPGIRELNRSHRGVDRATDVLSFGQRERRTWKDPLPPQEQVLGDLVISLPAIQRQARRHGEPWEQELLRVAIHGLLHLLGYDHATPVDRLRMFALQDRLLLQCRAV